MQQTDLLIAAASGPWCMGMILEMCYALGARRGEVLALRWSDIRDGRATISRSLSQTKEEGITFKALKGREQTEDFRVVGIPADTLLKLEDHRKRQDEFRIQFGPTYHADLDLVFANPDGTPFKPDFAGHPESDLFIPLGIFECDGCAVLRNEGAENPKRPVIIVFRAIDGDPLLRADSRQTLPDEVFEPEPTSLVARRLSWCRFTRGHLGRVVSAPGREPARPSALPLIV
jgi:hypothetical protein